MVQVLTVRGDNEAVHVDVEYAVSAAVVPAFLNCDTTKLEKIQAPTSVEGPLHALAPRVHVNTKHPLV
jgi:rhamnose utilization protein RhaD (predicted bifunctional aldolase and dehydrogenase)